MADYVAGAFDEAYAISRATQCRQFLFSLSLNPPPEHIATEQEFRDAVERAEAKLGLTGQPRAIIIHEKEGRRHAHAVWSRIDADAMKAINMHFFKSRLRDLSRDLFLDHGWSLPAGLQSNGGKNPLNFTLAEWQQAQRHKIDPREIKGIVRDAWARSDSAKAFAHALQEKGYILARGDRPGFVAVDLNGEVYAIGRWCGIKTKDVRAKLGSPDTLPSVADTRLTLRHHRYDQIRGYIRHVRDKHIRDAEPVMRAKAAMIARHRKERRDMDRGQADRWKAEHQARMERLNRGIRGLLQSLTGHRQVIIKRNEQETYHAVIRDREQRDAMVLAQMRERQHLQREITALRERQKQERAVLARSIRHGVQASRSSPASLGKDQDRKPDERHDKHRDPEHRPAHALDHGPPDRSRSPRFTFDR